MTSGQSGRPAGTARTGLVQGERTGLDCEHISVHVSLVAPNVSKKAPPVSFNVSRKRPRLRARPPTIASRYTYCFADHKERVIDLLMRVTRVSVETVAIVEAMRQLPRAEREETVVSHPSGASGQPAPAKRGKETARRTTDEAAK